MSAMFELALRAVRRQPFRYAATAVAIILGVAFFTGTSVLTTSFGSSIDSAITESLSGVDAAVRSAHSVEVAGLDIRPPVPDATAATVAAVDGVADAELFITGYAQVVDANGKTLADGALSSQGTAWIDDERLSPLRIVDGTPPKQPTDVVLDVTTFEQGDFALGDQVRVLPLGPKDLFTVVGTSRAEGSHRLGGQTLSFSPAGAEQVLGVSGALAVFVEADDGVSQDELLASLRSALSDDLEAVSGETLVEEYQDAVSQGTQLVTTALQIFPLIALFVGAFVIYNTFSITVVQRSRQMALMRAIGANERQVLVSVLAESLVIGIIGSILGVLVGIGLGLLLLDGLDAVDGGLGLSLVLPWPQMVFGLVAGTTIAVCSAYLPARRASGVPPIAALRETAVEERRTSARRTLVAVVVLVAGIVAAVAGILDDQPLTFLLGTVALLATVFLLGPIAVRPLTHVLSIPLVARAGVVGELARENAGRSPRRTATTAFSLAVGVMLVTAATIVAATISESVTGQLEKTIRADHLVVVDAPVVLQGGGIPAALVEEVGAVPGVEDVVAMRQASAVHDGGVIQVTGIDTSELTAVADVGSVDGTLELGPGQLAMGEDAAADRGIEIGDSVSIDFPQKPTTLELVGTYERSVLLGTWLVDDDEITADAPQTLASRILVRSSGRGVDDAIDEVLAGDPTSKVQTTAAFIDAQGAQVNQLLVLLYGLLGMSVLVALVGIINTMSLSIFERRRELGLLRAIGTTRSQLRRTIRYESGLVAAVGATGGILLGLFFGYLAAHAIDETFPDLAVPWLRIAVIGAAGVLAGVGAALLPARRAARLDVLEAIASGG